MKMFLASAALMVCCAGCFGMNEVDFDYFNLSTNEIFVNSIVGLPLWVTPGVLIPGHTENQLPVKSSISFEPVKISPALKIIWREGGISHEAKFKRDDLGIPAKIKKGKVRFTYLGGDKWRIKYFKK
jgi:hypothetical protein